MELICWFVDISIAAIPIFPIVEPIQVSNTLPAGSFLVLPNPIEDSFVCVSITYFVCPKSTGDAQRCVPSA